MNSLVKVILISVCCFQTSGFAQSKDIKKYCKSLKGEEVVTLSTFYRLPDSRPSKNLGWYADTPGFAEFVREPYLEVIPIGTRLIIDQAKPKKDRVELSVTNPALDDEEYIEFFIRENEEDIESRMRNIQGGWAERLEELDMMMEEFNKRGRDNAPLLEHKFFLYNDFMRFSQRGKLTIVLDKGYTLETARSYIGEILGTQEQYLAIKAEMERQAEVERLRKEEEEQSRIEAERLRVEVEKKKQEEEERLKQEELARQQQEREERQRKLAQEEELKRKKIEDQTLFESIDFDCVTNTKEEIVGDIFQLMFTLRSGAVNNSDKQIFVFLLLFKYENRFGDVKYGKVMHAYDDLSEIRQLSDEEWVDSGATPSSHFYKYLHSLTISLDKAGYDLTGDRVRGPEW
jgi:hypothetical protein